MSFSHLHTTHTTRSHKAGRLLTDWDKHERRTRGKKRQVRRVRSDQINADSRGWLARRNPERHSEIVQGMSKRQELFAWFNLLDDDDSGEISIAELEDPLIALGFATSREQVADLIATVDDDGTARGGEGASYATDRGRLTRPVVPQHL